MILKLRHYGPGPHKSGTPQSVHGRGGMARFKAAEEEKKAVALGIPYHPASYNVERAANFARGTVGELARVLGTTPEVAEEKTILALRQVLDENDIVIWRGARGAAGMVADGRFKTQFETGTSAGALDRDFRAEAEDYGLGIPRDAGPEARPIYGALADGGIGYGIFGFHMKDAVKNRATVTIGDSLCSMWDRGVVGAPFNKPDRSCFDDGRRMLRSVAIDRKLPPAAAYAGYIEAQIHGGVKLSDVKAVTLGAPSSFSPTWSREHFAERLNTVKALRAAGVPIRYHSSWTDTEIAAFEELL